MVLKVAPNLGSGRSQTLTSIRRQVERRNELPIQAMHLGNSKAAKQAAASWNQRFVKRKSKPEAALLRKFTGLEELDSRGFQIMLAEIVKNIQGMPGLIQPDFLRMYFDLWVRRFHDKDAMLTSTHYHFGSSCTAVVLLSNHPRYRHGRLMVNDSELLLWDQSGPVQELNPRGFSGVVDGLMGALEAARPRCVYGQEAEPTAETIVGPEATRPESWEPFAYADAGVEMCDADALPLDE
eukprot:Hpha_TRINITY_DN8803_c0_g2::TRINITY_DN8803_c0_g2_i1::g.141574::m.141574